MVLLRLSGSPAPFRASDLIEENTFIRPTLFDPRKVGHFSSPKVQTGKAMSLPEIPKTTVTKTVTWPDIGLKAMTVGDLLGYLVKLDPTMPVELLVTHHGEVTYEELNDAGLEVLSGKLVIGG